MAVVVRGNLKLEGEVTIQWFGSDLPMLSRDKLEALWHIRLEIMTDLNASFSVYLSLFPSFFNVSDDFSFAFFLP